jgi:hypothetical protein
MRDEFKSVIHLSSVILHPSNAAQYAGVDAKFFSGFGILARNSSVNFPSTRMLNDKPSQASLP